MRFPPMISLVILTALTSTVLGDGPKVGEKADRKGDEIVACGQFFHTGAPVVTWMDKGGYDAYQKAPLKLSAEEKAKGAVARSPSRFGARTKAASPRVVEKVQAGGWTLPLLQETVDQFVIHFDVCGTSKKCFEVLQDERGLSVQFMLDIDGTIYQTLDLKESAYHATKANGRSIGIEIANMGTFPAKDSSRVARWYKTDAEGKTRLTPPPGLLPEKSSGLVLRPSKDQPVVGVIQGEEYAQYDLTPEQYDSLIKLTAALCKTFPKIKCDYPRDASGKLVPMKLDNAVYDSYQGVLGHYHVQANKNDPGPALQWDRVINGARELMGR